MNFGHDPQAAEQFDLREQANSAARGHDQAARDLTGPADA